ncbi:MAG: hypothetical protein AAFQ67_05050 [Pseudomonadota bacterium]
MVPPLTTASAKTTPVSFSGVAAVGGGGGEGAGGDGGGDGIVIAGEVAPSEHAVSETPTARASVNPKLGFIALRGLPLLFALMTASNWIWNSPIMDIHNKI